MIAVCKMLYCSSIIEQGPGLWQESSDQSSPLSLVEEYLCFALIGCILFILLLCQPSYAIKNRFKTPWGISCLLHAQKGSVIGDLIP